MLLEELGHWEMDFEVVWPHPFSYPDSPPWLPNQCNYLSHTSDIVRFATHALSATVNIVFGYCFTVNVFHVNIITLNG